MKIKKLNGGVSGVAGEYGRALRSSAERLGTTQLDDAYLCGDKIGTGETSCLLLGKEKCSGQFFREFGIKFIHSASTSCSSGKSPIRFSKLNNCFISSPRASSAAEDSVLPLWR